MPTLEAGNSDPNMPLFTMFKGEPGTRKSTAALSYPGPQYWISTDQKMEALELPAKRWGFWGKGHVQYDDYTDWSTPRGKLEKLQVNCPFKTIVVDSITSIGDNMNRETIKVKRSGQGGEESGKGKKIGNIYVPGIEEYNAEASAFQELIALLKDIHKFHKVNIILIAHVVGQRNKDNDTNKLTHHSRVIITGGDKISGKIASYMTEVYHFNIESDFNVDSGEGKYGLFTQHTGNDYARTSLPLERKIQFNNEPLYEKWVEPAIRKLKAEQPVQRISTPTQTTPSPQPSTTFTPPTK
jgi:AAA domain